MHRIGRRQNLIRPKTRPVKTACAKKRRVNTQKKRLAAMGVPEAKLRTMDSKTIRALLRTPVKTAKMKW